MEQAVGMMFELLGLFGGLGLFFLAFVKALPELQRQGLLRPRPPKPIRTWQIHTPFLEARQVHVNPVAEVMPDDAVLQELRALRRQMQEMQSTCHQFDLSFDAALGRLEERVSRVETKVAAASPATAYLREEPRVKLG